MNGPTNAPIDAQIGHGEARRLPTPRERVARARSLAGRAAAYWKGTLAVLVAVAGAGVSIARTVPRVYRAECTVAANARIRTDDRDDSTLSPDQLLRQAARLKDMLTTRGRLESAIKKFGLYPATVADKTMLDAVEEMKPHVGFRSLEGAQYVVSFDGDDPDTVQRVTAYLSDSLIDDYAAGGIGDLRREADFLAKEERGSRSDLEGATRALTVFLAAHPEFAVEARQTAAPFAQGSFAPAPAQGIPLVPALPAGAIASEKDPALAALLRERARLEASLRASAAAPGGAPRPGDDRLADAQAQVEAAAKRVAETQADVASKSNLTEDHPDMRAARMSAEAAERQLRQARALFEGLQRLQAAAAGASSSSISEELRAVDAQIAARRTRIARPSQAPVAGAAGEGPVTAIVQLETEWQRLLGAVGEDRAHHDDLQTRAERAALALAAARVQTNRQMAVVEPPVRPTHPSKSARVRVAAAAGALAVLLAVAYAWARVALDDTLIDPDDVEALGVLTVLGEIPAIGRAAGRRASRAAA